MSWRKGPKLICQLSRFWTHLSHHRPSQMFVLLTQRIACWPGHAAASKPLLRTQVIRTCPLSLAPDFGLWPQKSSKIILRWQSFTIASTLQQTNNAMEMDGVPFEMIYKSTNEGFFIREILWDPMGTHGDPWGSLAARGRIGRTMGSSRFLR